MSSLVELRQEHERLTIEIEELKQIITEQVNKVKQLAADKKECKTKLDQFKNTDTTSKEYGDQVQMLADAEGVTYSTKSIELGQQRKMSIIELGVELKQYPIRRKIVMEAKKANKQKLKEQKVVLSGVKKNIKEQIKQEREVFSAMKKMFKTPKEVKVRVPKPKKTYGLNLSNIVKQAVVNTTTNEFVSLDVQGPSEESLLSVTQEVKQELVVDQPLTKEEKDKLKKAEKFYKNASKSKTKFAIKRKQKV